MSPVRPSARWVVGQTIVGLERAPDGNDVLVLGNGARLVVTGEEPADAEFAVGRLLYVPPPPRTRP